MKTKLCFVVPFLGVGGSSVVVHDLVTLIDKERFDVSLIVFFDIIDARYQDLLTMKSVSIYFLHKKHTIDFPFLRALKSVLRSVNPDIVSAHLTAIFYLNFFLNYEKTTVYHTIHNKPSADLPFLYRLLLYRHIKNRQIKLIGCSKFVAKESEDFYKVPVLGIQNGIFLPNRSPKEQEKVYDFVCVGRFSKIKRFNDLIASFSIFHEKHQSSKLALCGYGEEERDIRKTVKTFGLSQFVDIFGPSKDVSALYQASRCFCLFSSREGAPIVILEAMSFGLPIIATSVDGVPDFVHQGENGFLFNCGDVKRASDFMSSLLDDKVLYSKMSCASLAMSLSFSVQKTVAEYADVFSGITTF